MVLLLVVVVVLLLVVMPVLTLMLLLPSLFCGALCVRICVLFKGLLARIEARFGRPANSIGPKWPAKRPASLA